MFGESPSESLGSLLDLERIHLWVQSLAAVLRISQMLRRSRKSYACTMQWDRTECAQGWAGRVAGRDDIGNAFFFPLLPGGSRPLPHKTGRRLGGFRVEVAGLSTRAEEFICPMAAPRGFDEHVGRVCICVWGCVCRYPSPAAPARGHESIADMASVLHVSANTTQST
jgi:hypothetical protein